VGVAWTVALVPPWEVNHTLDTNTTSCW
jgi:hypothetical protein